MSCRPGRPIEPAHDHDHDSVQTCPGSIFLWLLRTSRVANPDPGVHVQGRFGARLGKDGTFVSHIEKGRRRMPADLRPQWLSIVGLDEGSLGHYLAAASALCTDDEHGWLHTEGSAPAEALLDDALHGAHLSASQWAQACRAAAELPMPRTQQDFCRLIIDAMATTHSEHHFEMAMALTELPAPRVVSALRESIEDAPWRAYHSVELLGLVDHREAWRALTATLESVDPWVERGLAEAMRRRVLSGGERDNPTRNLARLQQDLVERLTDASIWTSRVAFAHLVRALGRVPRDLGRRFEHEPDADVRIAVGLEPEDARQEAARRLRLEGIAATVDHMYGAATDDPQGEQLASQLMLSADDAEQAQAAHALSLSPYRSACESVLVNLTRDKSTFVRRAAGRTLEFFAPSATVVAALTQQATTDPNPSVRAQAMWSLITQANDIAPATLDLMLADSDLDARRSAVDLAAAAGYTTGLDTVIDGDDHRLGRLATFLRGHQFL